ncbi:leucine-rich repeat and guanylate kinase domain-containing protein [Loxodonta africana]|uniref:leucine-rich repeat and guanylate kinase domain-containing protein n=1 Tax=Loxodonta africana TaxID=9785 RepID=UPI0030D29257
MAAPGSGPQGGRSTSPPEAQSISLHSENERQCFSTTFPMGQRPKNAFHKTSSYLLRQLIHRYRRLDAEEDEDQKQAEVESEESSESEMLNLEEEFDGVLREEMVAEALCKLGRSGCGTGQVYLNLTLSGCDLIDISILCGYVHLQKLDLSVNKIEDLCCVSCMPYLLELNASQNKLTTFFNFKPPKNLKKVDFSYNQISEMSDLSAYQALTKLILDSNEIEEIKGLELCSNLTHLSLANNKIITINGLSMLPIKILCLSNNQIEKITGLEDLKALQNLDLSNNQISSLQGLENHDLLEVLNLEDNKIAELREIEYIKDLPLLRVLSLLRNPIQEKSDYWLFVIFMLLRLTELDHKKIKVEEKVSAVNKYDPPPEVIAAQDHLTHVVNSMMQPQRIFDSTLPSLDAPYPMLILAGPQACGKRELAHRLCRQFNAYFRYGACHTTRPPYFGEGDRVDYHFISREVYDEMLSMGKFILTYNYGNHSYGLNRDTVEGIARDGLASCIHMEIEGVRSLKCSYFEPRYILVVPMNKTKYEGHLRRKGLFSRAEIECAISRVDLYINMNEKFPGYFDAVINADDLDAAYQRLSQLIREYLGLTEEPAKGLAPTTAGASSSKKTLSGVPAHLVPSPRRLAKLQADGQVTEHLSGIQIHLKAPESQPLAPSQNQEPTQEEETHKEELSPNSHVSPEPPQQLSSTGLGIPQQAQDLAPNQEEGGIQQPGLSPKPLTTDFPENEALSSEVKASEVGLSSPTPPQVPPKPDQDKESGEAKVAPTSPPLSPGNSHNPLKEETPKAEVHVSTPYPELPHPQDSSADAKQTQDRDDPGTSLPRSRLAPTRLPQPRTLAPLQSRRPMPKLLTPSREEAPGAGPDQTLTPSPRPGPAQEGDSSKLPPISLPQPKPPQNPSSNAAHDPQSVQEERANEVKLPPIRPPVQGPAPQLSSQAPQDEEALKVKLPLIAPPSLEPQLPQDMGAQQDGRPAKEKKAPRVGHASGRKISDRLVSPQTREPAGAGKKKLPIQRETAKGSVHLKKALPGGHQTALQVESRRKPTPAKVPGHQNPSPHQSPRGNERREIHEPSGAPEPPVGEPLPKDVPLQEEQSEKDRHPGTEVHPQKKEPLHKKGRPQKTEPVSEPSERESEAPTQLPVTETQAPNGTSQTREGSVQRDNAAATKQPAKDRQTQKNGGVAQGQSPAAPQSQLSTEGQGSWQGRLRARGSQSTKV